MLKVEPLINVKTEKNVPTIVHVAVHSEFKETKIVTVGTSCGCTTAIPNFTIEPYQMQVVAFTVTKSLNSHVDLSFVTDNTAYTTRLNVTVN